MKPPARPLALLASVAGFAAFLPARALAELRPDGIEGGLSAALVPIAILELRAGFQLTGFFGQYGSLLRFDSPNASTPSRSCAGASPASSSATRPP